MKNVILLGATGSIGTQVCDLIEEFNNKYNLYAFSFGHNLALAKLIIAKFNPKFVCGIEENDVNALKEEFNNITYYYGNEGLLKLASLNIEEPMFINALVGSVGLAPTIKAIKSDKDVYLANKETLVIGGELVNASLKKHNVKLYPIDSEHSAIAQILEGKDKKDIKRLLITASGGSFRNKNRDELACVSVEDALNHPNWKMGAKITIDSATMMNKGFELIEAHYLFDLPIEKIVPIMHDESIVHSFVEFNDGSIFAQMGSSDMHLPIKYALEANHSQSNNIKPLDLLDGLELHFKKVDYIRYPMVNYALMAIKLGGYYPTILNASNEAAVRMFLNKEISFLQIEEIVASELFNHDYDKYLTMDLNLEEILKLDKLIKEKYLK